MTGKLITFEGIDGSGKSTQVKYLKQQLNYFGIKAIATFEPGGTLLANRIRKLILSGRYKHLSSEAEAILFSSARIDHINQVIKPALQAGKWVICDRFIDSTRAYQGLQANIDLDFLQKLEKITINDLYPDITFIMDIDVDISITRINNNIFAKPDRFEQENNDFHIKLRKKFLNIARQEPNRCIIIDASKKYDIIKDNIWKHIHKHFQL